jgi:hypothetical protein
MRKSNPPSEEMPEGLLMFALNNESTVVDEIRTLLFLDALHSGHRRDVITHEFAKRLEVAQRLTRQAINEYGTRH